MLQFWQALHLHPLLAPIPLSAMRPGRFNARYERCAARFEVACIGPARAAQARPSHPLNSVGNLCWSRRSNSEFSSKGCTTSDVVLARVAQREPRPVSHAELQKLW